MTKHFMMIRVDCGLSRRSFRDSETPLTAARGDDEETVAIQYSKGTLVCTCILSAYTVYLLI